MIYREITHTIRCDNCGKTTETNAASFEAAREAAERQGWAIISKGDWLRERHYCPKCKELLTNATKEES